MRRYGYLSSTNRFNLEVSNISILLTVMALLSALLVVTNFKADLGHALVALAFSIFCLAGMVLSILSFGTKRDNITSGSELLEQVNYGIMAFIAIALIQFSITTFSFTTIGLYDALFLYIAAVSETWLFHYFILILLYRLSPPTLFSLRATIVSIMDAAVFAAFHAVVYAMRPEAILAVFLGGIILALVNIMSRSILPALVAHILTNVPVLALLLAFLPP